MAKKIKLTPAEVSVDISNGSERGYYVGSDYMLSKMGRPFRQVNIMYTYYPKEETWPVRASVAYKDMEVHGAWDYPYDDYFPYLGGLEGSTDKEPFTCMRDIRRHGQDVCLTLTCDCSIEDERIIQIAKELRPFGRMTVRLNHECTGDWFTHNKRFTYKEVADFFVHFHDIMREYAPNVSMICCAGGLESEDATEVHRQEDFENALADTDVWSIDTYLALNWGWPFEVAERFNDQHKREDVQKVFNLLKKTRYYLAEHTGQNKKIVMSEINADGDVVGQYDQCEMMKEFTDAIIADEKASEWLEAFTMYQFRDDGRLGLEITDPNNPEVGIEQPLLASFRETIKHPKFNPQIVDNCCACSGDSAELDAAAIAEGVTLRWGAADDADGISIEVDFDDEPVFAELNFPEEIADASLMMEINGRWFYKKPGVTYIDLMPAFYDRKFKGGKLNLNIFATPVDGVNIEGSSDDWAENYYYVLKALPTVRVRTIPPLRKGETVEMAMKQE